MAKIHDLFIVELAEVIKGYGNKPDDKDPFRLSEFYRFYELPNIAVSRENFERMRPVEPERKKGEWTKDNSCPFCGFLPWYESDIHTLSFCPNCGADMRGEQNED